MRQVINKTNHGEQEKALGATTFHNHGKQSFGDDSMLAALSRQWGDTPWYLSSLGVHLFVFVLFLLFTPEPRTHFTPPGEIFGTLDVPIDSEPEPIPEPVTPDNVDISNINNPAPSLVPIKDFTPTTPESMKIPEIDSQDGTPDLPDPTKTMGGDEDAPMILAVAGGGRTPATRAFPSRTPHGKRIRLNEQGGGRDTERALSRGLAWLARQQKSDGSWEMPSYTSHKPRRIRTNAGLTSLCMLTFLGAGQTVDTGKYQKHVRRAEKYLINHKYQEGGRALPAPLAYEAPLMLMALSESYGMGSGIRDLKEKVNRLIAMGVEIQLPNGGFPEEPLDRDGSWHNTTWWLSALKSARLSGFKVPDSVFEKSFAEMFRCIQFEAAGETKTQQDSKLYANLSELPGSPRIEGGTTSKMAISMAVYILNSVKGIGLEDERIRGMCNLMALAGTNNNGIWDWPGGNIRIHDRFATSRTHLPMMFNRPNKPRPIVKSESSSVITPYFVTAAQGFPDGMWGKPNYNDKLTLASQGDRLQVDQAWYGACYWYWQGYSFSQLGAKTEYWQAFNNCFRPYLIYTQGQADGWPKTVTVDQNVVGKLDSGDVDGAWPGIFLRNGCEPFDEMGMTAATAFCSLLLEVYYRY